MDSILTGRRGGLSEGSFAHAHSPKLHALIRKVTKVTGAAEEDGIWPSAAPPSVLLSLSRLRPSVRGRRTAAAARAAGGVSFCASGVLFLAAATTDKTFLLHSLPPPSPPPRHARPSSLTPLLPLVLNLPHAAHSRT